MSNELFDSLGVNMGDCKVILNNLKIQQAHINEAVRAMEKIVALEKEGKGGWYWYNELDLNMRTYNCLKRYLVEFHKHIHFTSADIANMFTFKTFHSLPNVGRKSANDLKDALKVVGVLLH